MKPDVTPKVSVGSRRQSFEEEVSMDLKEALQKKHHEQLLICNDEETGLFAFIAIHNTILGPSLGGSRMWQYKSTEDAMIDALRLSRGMTYKASLAGLKLGGGKAVIMGDPKTDKTPELFRKFGQYVDSLSGRYITAEDVGTTVEDMTHVMKETKHVVGIPKSQGGSGDPSPFTALGVYHGIRASLKHLKGDDALNGVSVAVQGVGNVGHHLVTHLVESGAKVFIADIDEERVRAIQDRHPKVEAVKLEEVLYLDVDVISPCALGAVVNDESVERIKARIVAGAANNQLKEDRHGDILFRRGILYAPDYCINAGGLINVYQELLGWYNEERATQMTLNIYNSLMDIYNTAASKSIPTYRAADIVALDRIEKAKDKKKQEVNF